MPSNFDIFLLEHLKFYALIILYVRSKELLELAPEVLITIELFLISMKKTLLKIAGLFRPLINFTSAFGSMDICLLSSVSLR